jgi:hypothetical protein
VINTSTAVSGIFGAAQAVTASLDPDTSHAPAQTQPETKKNNNNPLTGTAPSWMTSGYVACL